MMAGGYESYSDAGENLADVREDSPMKDVDDVTVAQNLGLVSLF